MSKLYRKPVEVRLAGDVPEAFYWRGKWLLVESIVPVRHRRYSWAERDPGETFRVHVQGGGVYDLVRTREGWVLERFGTEACKVQFAFRYKMNRPPPESEDQWHALNRRPPVFSIYN